VNEINPKSISNISSPPRIKSQEQQKAKPSTTSDKTSSKPIVRQSMKNFLPFRNHSPIDLNPVLALSNEPFVKLTSIRKLDQDMTLPSTILQSNINPSFRLFPNQSDSEINLRFSNRSNSSRLPKHGSCYSLPDVSLQRNDSISTTHVNLIESPVIPKFLCLPSDQNEEEVFLTTDQDQVVAASTFGDSSMKSKVLRASYRGKAHTMDRRINNSTPLRSLSTSTTNNTIKHSSNTQSKHFITKTDENTTNRQVNYPIDSVLNVNLQLEQTSTTDIQRRHTISTDTINPLFLNGLTNDENELNSRENIDRHDSSMHVSNNNNDQSIILKENPSEYERLQNNSSINSQTIE